jgi:hypothetical protein
MPYKAIRCREIAVVPCAVFSVFCAYSSISPQKMWSPTCIILSLLVTAPQVLSESFDFVIIGGGTSGLVVANRLSELNVTVAIIEAGASVRNNSNVTRVDGFTLALNTPIDWQYQSTNQSYAGGQKISYHSGKALGGTSTLNGLYHIP